MDDEWMAGLDLVSLQRFARVLTGDRQLAEDVVQDALVQLLRRRTRLAEIDSLDRYVRRMVINGYLSWRRKWARITPTDRLPDRGLSPDATALIDLRAELRAALGGLTRQQRAAVVLRFYLDLTDDDAAAEMGCSVTTLRSHISRGLAALRVDVHHADYTEGSRP